MKNLTTSSKHRCFAILTNPKTQTGLRNFRISGKFWIEKLADLCDTLYSPTKESGNLLLSADFQARGDFLLPLVQITKMATIEMRRWNRVQQRSMIACGDKPNEVVLQAPDGLQETDRHNCHTTVTLPPLPHCRHCHTAATVRPLSPLHCRHCHHCHHCHHSSPTTVATVHPSLTTVHCHMSPTTVTTGHHCHHVVNLDKRSKLFSEVRFETFLNGFDAHRIFWYNEYFSLSVWTRMS
jgi:hypothetical protein